MHDLADLKKYHIDIVLINSNDYATVYSNGVDRRNETAMKFHPYLRLTCPEAACRQKTKIYHSQCDKHEYKALNVAIYLTNEFNLGGIFNDISHF